jgi:IS30 family transposase
MMSDSRIAAHFVQRVISSAVHAFSEPRNRRDIAQRLRNIRNTSGHYAARLVLAQLSAENVHALAERAERTYRD